MGAFFTNVQVSTGSHPPEDVRSIILTALRRSVASEEYTEVDPDDPTAERVLMVGPAGSEAWIAVYDSATESQDEAQLDALTSALSIAVEGGAVSVLIHDSDVLGLRLWRCGELADAYSSCPDYFGPVSKERQVSLAGQPERWRELLRDDASPADLRHVWDEPLLFAEATLAASAELLGMDLNRCAIGLRYLLHDGANEITSALDAAGYIRLAFRSAQTPATVAPPAPPSGPPVLSMESGATGVNTSIGESLTWAMCAAGNVGGPSQGLQVVVWGSALEQGLVTIDTVGITMPSDDDTTSPNWVTHIPEARRAGDLDVRCVRLDDYPLLGDTAGWGDAFSTGHWRSPHAAIAARMQRRISVQLHGVAQTVGQGQLHVGFVPLANPSDGQTSWTFTVTVARQARRPLRYAAESPGANRSLLDLGEPRVLVALIALGTDRSTSARIAADAIATWNQAIAPQHHFQYEGFVRERFDYRPRPFRLASRDVPDGPPWRELRSTMEVCNSLQAIIHSGGKGDEGGSPDFTSGFLFEADGLPFQHGHDTAAPQLALWWDTAGSTDELMSQQAAMLVAIVDDVMVRGNGLQAFLARWNWSSQYQSGAQHIPYEQACGLGGQCTTGRAWCTRWLRAAAEQLWLGPELLARLPDRAALQLAAELTPTGTGLHAVLRPTATLDDLEQALAAILPEAADWTRGMNLLYGHAYAIDASPEAAA